MGSNSGTDSKQVEIDYPSLLKRVQSTFIDALLIVLAMGLVSGIIDRLGSIPDWASIAIFISLWGGGTSLCPPHWVVP